MRKISKIIIHCSATPSGRAVTINEIDAWHKQRGFACIGYHYVIGINGEIWKGRDEQRIGAHCLNHNKHSIGVCYIGGLSSKDYTPKDTRTDMQKAALIKLLRELKVKYPNTTIHGHNEFAAKECPCFNANNEYKNI